MSQLNKVLLGEGGSLTFWCPGCDGAHAIQHGAGSGPRWGWNGSLESPTFTPSVLVRGVQRVTEEEHAVLMAGGHIEPRPFVCHSFVTDGCIQFLGDCTHALAGKTVDLPNWDEV
jgi:hypothetical protein